MEEIILNATARSEKPKKVRNLGFTPGVLNGPGTVSVPVQFEIVALNKIIAKHDRNAKLWVLLDSEKKFGFIKEVQMHPFETKVIHVAIQMVSKDEESKMKLPITFHGHSEVENRLLQLQVLKAEIEVKGKLAFMPDVAIVDISKKKAGDNVTAIDFNLPSEITILDSADEIYAIIKAVKEEVVEEVEKVEVVEEVKPAE